MPTGTLIIGCEFEGRFREVHVPQFPSDEINKLIQKEKITQSDLSSILRYLPKGYSPKAYDELVGLFTLQTRGGDLHVVPF